MQTYAIVALIGVIILREIAHRVNLHSARQEVIALQHRLFVEQMAKLRSDSQAAKEAYENSKRDSSSDAQ